MKIDIRLVTGHNFPQLQVYHGDLSAETKKRFAPHGFSEEALSAFYSDTINEGFIATCNDEVIAYAVLRLSSLPYDAKRFQAYGFIMNDRADATYAPSVADKWQGRGIAAQMLTYIRTYARENGRTRIFLWGGVQPDNIRALQFYRKQGFIEIGSFEHNGHNVDMVLL